MIKLEQIEVPHHDTIVNFHVFQETILWFSFNTTSILRDQENNKRKQSSATSPCVKLTIFFEGNKIKCKPKGKNDIPNMH